jgi:hypothetical protein
VHSPGGRASRPLTVEVTDETGQPVQDATISFHTPIDGPSGVFPSGLRSEILQTDARGRASMRNLQLNRTSGRFLVRIVAARDQARAGALASQYIAEPKGTPQAAAKSSHGNGKWLALAAVLGGGAVAGYYVSMRSTGFAATASAPSALSIGNPTITVGKP